MERGRCVGGGGGMFSRPCTCIVAASGYVSHLHKSRPLVARTVACGVWGRCKLAGAPPRRAAWCAAPRQPLLRCVSRCRPSSVLLSPAHLCAVCPELRPSFSAGSRAAAQPLVGAAIVGAGAPTRRLPPPLEGGTSLCRGVGWRHSLPHLRWSPTRGEGPSSESRRLRSANATAPSLNPQGFDRTMLLRRRAPHRVLGAVTWLVDFIRQRGPHTSHSQALPVRALRPWVRFIMSGVSF